MRPLTLFATLALLCCLVALTACQSGPETDPETEADPAPVPETHNLLSEGERSQLYVDLDQYTGRYMIARDQGNSRAWMSLHASVLMPMVERNMQELLLTAESKAEPRYRVIAVRALGFASDLSGPRVSPTLVGTLTEEDVNVVNSALISLYLLGWAETPVAPIVAQLNHQDMLIRSSAALALSKIVRRRRDKLGDSYEITAEIGEASGRLMAMANRPEEDPFVRAHAAAALGSIGDLSAADVLINLLVDEHMVVRVKAVQALGSLEAESALKPLVDVLAVTEGRGEATIIVASLEKIAKSLNYPVDKDALGQDPETWANWYEAVKEGK